MLGWLSSDCSSTVLFFWELLFGNREWRVRTCVPTVKGGTQKRENNSSSQECPSSNHPISDTPVVSSTCFACSMPLHSPPMDLLSRHAEIDVAPPGWGVPELRDMVTHSLPFTPAKCNPRTCTPRVSSTCFACSMPPLSLPMPLRSPPTDPPPHPCSKCHAHSTPAG